jgi:heme-degrading monooxygenase HmoA
MVIEQVRIQTKPGSEQEFEAALEQARDVIGQAHGFRSFRAMRGIEEPSTFLVLVEWETIEDHLEGFRESELFERFREAIGPYFAGPPEVTHYESPVVTG